MRTNLRAVLKQFDELSKEGQNSLLRNLCHLTKANALMIGNRLCGQADFSDLVELPISRL
jgi:hypothetical protein